MNKTILVTGADGQLGQELQLLSKNYPYDFIFSNRHMLDITDNQKVDLFFEHNKIDIIINCAAYTAVDMAEKNQEQAYAINYTAVEKLAKIAKQYSIKLIHISTDYVFDGKNYKPYCEEDMPNPCGVYSTSKYLGEQSLININPRNSIILRSSWIYSPFGRNFLKTILRLTNENKTLKIVFDQIGTPTYGKDLAGTILDILPKINNQSVELFHYSNEGIASWYDFAKEILDIHGLSNAIIPIETIEYPTPVKRPHFSVLNKSKIKKTFGVTIPHWKDSLKECLQKKIIMACSI